MARLTTLTALFLIGLAGAVQAGSALSEVEYRYPCYSPITNQRVTMDYGGFGPSAVEFGFQFDRPVLMMNERLSFEQPYPVVVFEYFSACELVQRADRATFRSAQSDRAFAEMLMRDADCAARYFMQREGLARSYEDVFLIVDYYQYQKAEEYYLGVPFWLRAENIMQYCPP